MAVKVKENKPVEKVPIQELIDDARRVGQVRKKEWEEKFEGVNAGRKRRLKEEEDYQKQMQQNRKHSEEKFGYPRKK